MTFGVTSLDCCISGRFQNLVCYFWKKDFLTSFYFGFHGSDLLTLISHVFLSVTVHLKLKSRYRGHVKVAFEYAKTIDDFDNLVDPCTLYRFLGTYAFSLHFKVFVKKEAK